MATISIFFRIIFQNIEYILPLVVFLSVITIIGIGIFVSIIKKESWGLIIPAGAITGLFGFILFLGIFSYFLKGKLGILIILIAYFIFGLFIFKKFGKLPKIKPQLNFNNISLASLSLLFMGFVATLVGANQYGGDVIAYWGFATSFAKGNYPIYSPWQPDFLSIHHKGTYMFEGAMHALTNVDMRLVHTIYSYFVIVTGFFLLWVIVRKTIKKDFISIIPALVAYFSFGGIFIPLTNTFRKFISPEVEHITGRLPLLLDAKNRLGGASNLPEFVYINHRAAAFSGVLLLFLFMFTDFKIEKYKPVILAALSVGILSSDEIYLPFILFAVIGYFIYKLFKTDNKKRFEILKNFILGGLAFIALFSLVDNAIRDSMLVPSETPRFQILTNVDSFKQRMVSLKSAILRGNENSSFFWLLPSIGSFLLITLLFLIPTNIAWLWIWLVGILGIFLSYFTVEHTFYPQNNARFLHVLYQFIGIALTFSLVYLSSKGTKRVRQITSAILTFFILPAVFFAIIYLYPLAKRDDYQNYYGSMPASLTLKWLSDNVPRERVFFIDGFLTDNLNHSPYALQAIQNFGLIVPVSPAGIRVHTPDYGIEAIDLIYTLNPDVIEKLKVKYLFITNQQFELLVKERREDLANISYFEKVYENHEGKIFKINPQYIAQGKMMDGGIRNLVKIIRPNSKIYVDYPFRIDGTLRAAVLLLLKDNTKLFSEWRSGTFNYIETKINFNPPSFNDRYDYLILGPNTSAREVCNCKNAEKIWQTYGLKLYEIRT